MAADKYGSPLHYPSATVTVAVMNIPLRAAAHPEHSLFVSNGAVAALTQWVVLNCHMGVVVDVFRYIFVQFALQWWFTEELRLSVSTRPLWKINRTPALLWSRQSLGGDAARVCHRVQVIDSSGPLNVCVCVSMTLHLHALVFCMNVCVGSLHTACVCVCQKGANTVSALSQD